MPTEIQTLLGLIFPRSLPPAPPALAPAPAADAPATDRITPETFSVLSPVFHLIATELDTLAPHILPLVARCGDYKVVDHPGLMVDEHLLAGLVSLPLIPVSNDGPAPSRSHRSASQEERARDTPSYGPFSDATVLGFDSFGLLVRFVILTCWRRRRPGDYEEHDGDWRPFEAYFPRVTRFVIYLGVFQGQGVDGWGYADAWEKLLVWAVGNRQVGGRTMVELVLREQAAVFPKLQDYTTSVRIARMLRLVCIPGTLRVIFPDSPVETPPLGTSHMHPQPLRRKSLALDVISSVLRMGRGGYTDNKILREGAYEWVVYDAKELREMVKQGLDEIPKRARKETEDVLRRKFKFVELKRR